MPSCSAVIQVRLPRDGRSAARIPETEARPALSRISDLIVARAADVARASPGGSSPTAAVLADAFDASTPLASRLVIGEAILHLQAAE